MSSDEPVTAERAEHLAWCKERALEYVDQGDLASALASMASDLAKHPDTKQSADPILIALGLIEVQNNDRAGMRRFITGFN